MRVAALLRPALAAGLVLLVPAACPAQNITLGQTDTFESGTTLNWGVGSAIFAAPTVQPGGPAGPADHFLQVLSGQPGTPPRMVVLNRVQWTGDYNTAGVNAVEMDLINLSSTAVALRLGVASDTSGGAGYVSANPVSLPNQGQWVHATFNLTDSQMTPVGVGTPTLTQVLSSVAEVRVLSAVSPSLHGDAIVATIGVDNIHAVFIPVPEPGLALTAALAAAGLAGGWRRVRAGRGSRR
ncbi:MAG TPA: hypothetical protein VGF55_07000 [Gemmataceae bacterium]|jgi:hypothetical protein